MAPRPLSSTVWASPQLALDALPGLAASGIRRLVSNRPDGEEAGQPSAAEMAAAAREAGLDFVWLPVSGAPGPEQASALAALLKDEAPTVLFCRSGMRSAAAWAMAERIRGVDADVLRTAAAGAGYDLGRLPL